MNMPLFCYYSVSVEIIVFQEFILSEDYNKMLPARTYQGETGSVCSVLYMWACWSGVDVT